MAEENKKRRIGAMQGTVMIFVALAIDGVQFLINLIPLVGWLFVSILSVGVALMFWTWFKLNGVSFIKGKTALLRVTALSVGTFLEVFPLFNSVPAWTFAVGITVITIILEDKAQKIGISNLLSPSKRLGRNASKNGRIKRNKQVGIV